MQRLRNHRELVALPITLHQQNKWNVILWEKGVAVTRVKSFQQKSYWLWDPSNRWIFPSRKCLKGRAVTMDRRG